MRNPYLEALIHPINLSMLAIVTTAGLCAAWWLFPLGILFWIIMILNIAHDPSLRIFYQIKSRQPLAPRFQTKFEKIESWQVKLYNTLIVTKPKVRKAFQPVQNEANNLANKIHDLCQRNSALENYRLVNAHNQDLENEWITLKSEIEKTSDPSIKESLTHSLRNIETRMGRHQQVTTQLESVDDQIEVAEKTMEKVVTDVLRLQALGLSAIKKDRERLLEQIHHVSKQIEQFEENQLLNGIDQSNLPKE